MRELLIITNIKKTIIFLDDIVSNYPKDESILRDNIKTILYKMIETVYISNLDKLNRLSNCYLLLSHIKILDFYLKLSLDKRIISLKKYSLISNYLNSIIKLLYGWINSCKE